MGLIADAFTALVGTPSARLLENLLNRIALGIVDRDDADLFGKAQTVGVSVTIITLLAPWIIAEYAAINPTGPAPYTTMESPGCISTRRVQCHPVGKMSESIT